MRALIINHKRTPKHVGTGEENFWRLKEKRILELKLKTVKLKELLKLKTVKLKEL